MTTSMSPRAARSRDKMLRAATELIVESGPRAVTVDAVAEASGVAKSTLYRHWSSRDEMLVDVVRCNVPELVEPDLGGGFADALSAYLSSAASALSDPEWSRMIPSLMSLRVSMPELADVVEADRTAKTDVLRQILDVGAAEGVIPADLDPIDVEKLLFGPIFFTALLGEHERVERLAALTVERFIASYS